MHTSLNIRSIVFIFFIVFGFVSGVNAETPGYQDSKESDYITLEQQMVLESQAAHWRKSIAEKVEEKVTSELINKEIMYVQLNQGMTNEEMYSFVPEAGDNASKVDATLK